MATNGKTKAAKKPAKKAAKKVTKKETPVKAAKVPNEDQKAVFKLLTRANGASLADLIEAGYSWPAQGVLKMAERNGYKTSKKKEAGERTRYFAVAK